MKIQDNLSSIKIKRSDFLLICAALFFFPAVFAKLLFKFFLSLCNEVDCAIVLSGIMQDFAMIAIILCAYKSWNLSTVSFNPISKCYAIFRGFIEFLRVSLYAFCGNIIGCAIVAFLYYVLDIHLITREQFLIYKLRETQSLQFVISTVVLCVIVAPIAEELVFRYFLYRSLKNFCPVRSAMVLSAIIFAALHANFGCLFGLIAVGFCLTKIYEKYRTLIPCIVAHGLFNLVTILFILIPEQECIFCKMEREAKEALVQNNSVNKESNTPAEEFANSAE